MVKKDLSHKERIVKALILRHRFWDGSWGRTKCQLFHHPGEFFFRLYSQNHTHMTKVRSGWDHRQLLCSSDCFPPVQKYQSGGFAIGFNAKTGSYPGTEENLYIHIPRDQSSNHQGSGTKTSYSLIDQLPMKQLITWLTTGTPYWSWWSCPCGTRTQQFFSAAIFSHPVVLRIYVKCMQTISQDFSTTA